MLEGKEFLGGDARYTNSISAHTGAQFKDFVSFTERRFLNAPLYLGSFSEGRLCSLEVSWLACPGGDRGGLQGSPIGEGQLLVPGLSRWLSAAELKDRLGWHCERQAEKVLRRVKGCLSPGLREAVEDEAAQRGEGQD
ncbi:UNVERIFIED_CONTAM: hypothetical protein FKN15_014026 [Acipenser sinensis]